MSIIKSVPVYGGCNRCLDGSECHHWHGAKVYGHARLHSDGSTSYLPQRHHLKPLRYASGKPPKCPVKSAADLRCRLQKSLEKANAAESLGQQRRIANQEGRDFGMGWRCLLPSSARALLKKGQGDRPLHLVPDSRHEAILQEGFWLAAKQAQACTTEDRPGNPVPGLYPLCVLEFEPGQVTLRTADGVGQAKISLDAGYSGPRQRIGLNIGYLLEGLGVWPLKLCWSSESMPGPVHFDYGLDWSLLVMSMND